MAPCPRLHGLAGSMRQAFLWTLLPIAALALIASRVADAQVTTDITSSGLNTQIDPVGNSYNITGGTRPGGGPNLFHSFGNFSVGAGDTANFSNDSGLATSNIIGRVTDGNISSIYGTIQTTDFGSANLFLMNPSGFVFGPTALLNVGGAVSFTTAQYIRLFDGIGNLNFYANPANDGLANSILTIDPGAFTFLNASPAAYGFLTAPDPNATLTVQGSNLSDPSGQSISLVGGKVVIEDGAQLSAPSGRILLATAASPGEFDVNTLQSLPNVDETSFTSFGTVSMASGSSFDVHGTDTVWIKGGQLVLSVNDAMLTTTESNAPVNTISLSLGSSIVTANAGADPGGDMQLTASSVNLLDGGQIVSRTSGTGDGGNITIAATNTTDNSVVVSGSDSTSTPSGITNPFFGLVTSGIYSITSAEGNGGQIVVTAPTLTVDNFGSLITASGAEGNGGNISINATHVGVTAGGNILSLSGFDIATLSPTGSSGNGGNVTIRGFSGDGDAGAQSVTLNAGLILSGTFGKGNGGNVLITSETAELNQFNMWSLALDNVDPRPGSGGNITLNVNQLTLKNASQILSSAGTSPSETGYGSGGNVSVGTGGALGFIHLFDGSGISSQTSGAGSGGSITLRSESVVLGGGSSIGASTSGTGSGGDVELNVETLELSSSSTIRSITALAAPNAGPGGKITVQGLGEEPGTWASSVSLSGEGSGITSSSEGTGRLGDIVILGGKVTLANKAVIQAGTQQDTASEAGNVTIMAHSIDIFSGSRIASQVFAANAGQVTIDADRLILNDGSIQTSTASVGQAGNVEIAVGKISLTNGSVISSASTGTEHIIDFATGQTTPPGAAGNITITASGNFTSDASSITTSAEANRGGDISITAHHIQLTNGTLVNANSNGPIAVTQLVLDANNQLVEQEVGDGNAGNIRITSGSTFLMENSSVTTEASQASGGQISINAPDMIRLIDSKVSTSVAGAANDSDGGNISIDPDFVVLKGSQILAQAFAGKGGAIDITAGLFLADSSSVVDASSTQGVSGTVEINAPINNLSEVIARLPESLLAVETLLRAACAARMAQGDTSSFVERGRDSIPAGPDGLLASPYLPMTSEHSDPLQATPSAGLSGIQLRRPFGKELPSPVTLISDHAACSS